MGLTSQLRRAAISIPSNIAEGAGRDSDKMFNQFIGYSIGSGYEVETQLLLTKRVKLIPEDEVNELLTELTEILKMLYNFRKTLK